MRFLLRAGLALGLVTAACKDSVGTKSLANPQATTAQMAALDTLFDVAVLTSFSALSPDIAPTAPSRVARLQTLAGATNPLTRSSALRPYGKGLESARMMRRLVPTLTGASAAALFPPEVVGKTFEWNITTDVYEPTARAGAPTSGVRFILYAVDPLTNMPAEPLVEVGYVDLNDESTSSVAKLHITVAGVNGTPVYVDYSVTLASLSATSASMTTAGYITNGTSSADTLRFNGSVTASGSATSATVTQDVSLDVNSHDIHVRLWERVAFTETTASLRISFRFEHGGEVVTLDGTFDLDEPTQTATGTVTVRVDGGLFATCTVAADANSYSLTCEGADADGLNADEAEALQAIGDAIASVSEVFAGLFGPPMNILGG